MLGLVLWAITCAPTAISLAGALGTRPPRACELGWLGGGAVYGAALAIGLSRGRWRPVLVAVEASAAVIMIGTGVGSFTSVLLAIVAWQAGLAFDARRARVVVCAQAAIGAVVAAALAGIGWSHLLNHVVLQGMGLSMALVVRAEQRGRHALERTHQALAVLREELAARTRDAERGRIARELHDALGHHLVALSLQLEAARHQAAGAARGALVRAQHQTRALLGNVRDVVRACRDPAPRVAVSAAVVAAPAPALDREAAPPDPSRRWPVLLGLALWSINGCVTMPRVSGELATRAGWLLAFAAYGLALLAGLRGDRHARGWTALGGAAALVVTALGACYFCTLLLALIAWQAGFAFTPRRALLWVAVQAVASAVVLGGIGRAELATIGTSVMLQAMGLSMALVARGEARTRRAFELANAALLATRDELANRERAAERGRIAQALHGALGQHLASLAGQLALADPLDAGPARGAVTRAQALTRTLLGELAAVVRAGDAPVRVDVPEALRELIGGLERPHAHLTLRGDLVVPDAAIAHTLVRCVQEMITNVLKHAVADNVWIDVARLADRLEARVSDDGRVAAPRARAGGHGLAGMTERLAQHGGELSIDQPAAGGWTVVARLPIAAARPA